MDLFHTILSCPAALRLAADRAQNLSRRLPFLRSGKECTDAGFIQDFTRCDEAVLHRTLAMWNVLHCYCGVELFCLQPYFIIIEKTVCNNVIRGSEKRMLNFN